MSSRLRTSSAAPRHPARRQRAGGFTLIEAIVSLIVVAELIIGVLSLFDFNNKLAHVQLQLADMQQSLRIAQYDLVRNVRMAGRGGLPVATTGVSPLLVNPTRFSGPALALRNNIPASQNGLVFSAAATTPPSYTNPRVVVGTDILTVRGVFSTPIYQINVANSAEFTVTRDVANNVTGGTITIHNMSPSGVPQAFSSASTPGGFEDAITHQRPEALVLVSPVDDSIYAVVELDWANSTISPDKSLATITYKATGDAIASQYALLSAGGVYPANMSTAAFVGIVEEYQYYVREDHGTPSDLTSEMKPTLSRARLYPNTGNPWDGDTVNLHVDIAEGIRDFQVAVAVDLNGDGAINENVPSGNQDEYLFNDPADNLGGAPWSPAASPFPKLYYVRLNTIAQTDRRDFKYEAPLIEWIEDHVYDAAPTDAYDPNGRLGRQQRRRYLQTIVDLRNSG